MLPHCFPKSEITPMRLDEVDPASLQLPEEKADVIIFDDRLIGFGLRLRRHDI